MVVGPFIIANFATILRRKLKREKLDLEEKQLVIVLSLATVSSVRFSLCHGTRCDVNNAILRGTKKVVEQPSRLWVC